MLAALVLLLAAPPPAQAQSGDERVEYAALTPEGTLVIHLAVPRGQTVEEATLTLGGSTITLDPEPVPLPVVQWILLDAGETMINFQLPVQASVTRFLRASGVQSGVLIYGEDADLLQPTERFPELEAFLSSYAPRTGQPACIGDAFAALSERWPRAVDQSVRLLVISGPLERQTRCLRDSIGDVFAPVDVIYIGSEPEDALNEIAERSGGVVRTANLSTIEARVNEVGTSWTMRTFRLTARVDALSAASGRLRATLSGGDTITARVPDIVTLEAESDPTATDIPAGVGLATLPPRATPTGAPTAALATPNPTQGESVSVPPTERPQQVANVPTAQTAPTEAPTSAPTETVAASTTETPLIPGTTIPLNTTTLVLLGLGGLAVTVLIGSIVVGLRGSGAGVRRRTGNYYSTLDTVFERRPMTPPTNATKVNQPLQPLSQDDEELLITQVMEDENFQRAMSGGSAAVGRVRVNTIPSREYDLTPSGLTVGRSKENDIVLNEDKFISRRLLRLVVRSDGVYLERLSSSNPVIVSGQYMSDAPRRMRAREVIQVSPTLTLVYLSRESDSSTNDTSEDETQL